MSVCEGRAGAFLFPGESNSVLGVGEGPLTRQACLLVLCTCPRGVLTTGRLDLQTPLLLVVWWMLTMLCRQMLCC